MQKLLIGIAFILHYSFLHAQEIKVVVNDNNAELREVAAFNKIEINTSAAVFIVNNATTAVAVSNRVAEDNKQIITTVENGILKITGSCAVDKCKLYISVNNLEYLTINNGSVVKFADEITLGNTTIILKNGSVLRGTVKATQLNLQVQDASVITGKIEATAIKVEGNNASVVTLSGKCNNVQVNANNASVIKAEDLIAAACNVIADNASVVKVHVTANLQVQANNSSTVTYKGEPYVEKEKIANSSVLKKNN